MRQELSYTHINGRKIVARHFYLEALIKAHKEIEQLGIGIAGMYGFVTGQSRTSSWRSLALQRELMAKGASKTLNSHHRRGVAVDCYPDWGYINKIKPIMNKYGLFNDLAYLSTDGRRTSDTKSDATPIAWDGGHWNYISNLEGFKYDIIDELPHDIKEFTMETNPNLIKQNDRPEIYLFNGETRFHIPDFYTFSLLGFTVDDVTLVDDVSEYPLGASLPSLSPSHTPVVTSPEEEEGEEPSRTRGKESLLPYLTDYRSQVPSDMCVAFAIRNAIYGLTSGERDISEIMLYVMANELYGDSGDTERGLHISSAMHTMKNYGVFDQAYCPFGSSDEDHHAKYERGLALMGPERESEFVGSRIRGHEAIRHSIQYKSPVVVTIDKSGSWRDGEPIADDRVPNPSHALTLIDYSGDDYFAIDSNQYSERDDGMRRIHKSRIIESWEIRKL